MARKSRLEAWEWETFVLHAQSPGAGNLPDTAGPGLVSQLSVEKSLSSSFFQWSHYMNSTCYLSEHGFPDSRVRLIPVPQSVPLFQRKSTLTRLIILPNWSQWLPSLCLPLCSFFLPWPLLLAVTCSLP